jgi:site-specific recombinase XerC
VYHAALFKAPLLIYHGTHDNLIPVAHSPRHPQARRLPPHSNGTRAVRNLLGHASIKNTMSYRMS